MSTDDPRTLLHDAAAGPVATLDHDELRRRARNRTRTRWSAVAVAVLTVVAGVGALVANLQPPPSLDVVDTPDGGVAPAALLPGLPQFPVTLDLPPAGEVTAVHIGERPVFVVHRDGGEVLVVDAISPHPSATGPPKVVAFCRDPWVFETDDEQTVIETPGVFWDLWVGSPFALDGAWLGGPAPTGLPRYQVLSVDGDTVDLGPPGTAPEREVGPFKDLLGPSSDINARPVSDDPTDCGTEYDQTRSAAQPDDPVAVLWHQPQYPDRWAYPFTSAATRSGENEEVRACEPASLHPTYLPWQEGTEGTGDPVETQSGTEDSPNAFTTWAADPDALRQDDADGDLSYASVAVLHEYEPAGEEFPTIEVRGHRAELVWVGDPGVGQLSLRWQEMPGPCGALAVSLRIWRSPPYLEDVPDQEAYDQADGEEMDRLMGRHQEAIEQEIIKIAESLEDPEG